MAKDVFRFKQFTIRQAFVGMKVSTDACIQGAFCQHYIKEKNGAEAVQHILDIGAGTGLLGLMLTQEFKYARLTAVEFNADACLDARYNFGQSVWTERLQLFQERIQDFDSTEKFDIIICNPPFFKDHLPSPQLNRQAARHDESLSKEDLVHAIQKHLSATGIACVLYPVSEWSDWETVLNKTELKTLAICRIRPNIHKPANRIIGIYARTQMEEYSEEELIIYDSNNQYTADFKDLLSPYYLAL